MVRQCTFSDFFEGVSLVTGTCHIYMIVMCIILAYTNVGMLMFWVITVIHQNPFLKFNTSFFFLFTDGRDPSNQLETRNHEEEKVLEQQVLIKTWTEPWGEILMGYGVTFLMFMSDRNPCLALSINKSKQRGFALLHENTWNFNLQNVECILLSHQ